MLISAYAKSFGITEPLLPTATLHGFSDALRGRAEIREGTVTPVSAARIHADRTGGVVVVFVQVTAALSFYVDRLRIRQAVQSTQPS